MFKFVRRALLSAALAVSFLPLSPAGVMAGESDVSVIGGASQTYGLEIIIQEGRDERRCSPNRALNKALRLGLRRPRIISVGRRTIRVSGRRHGDRVIVVFARDRRCSLLR